MSQPFSRTLRALQNDRPRHALGWFAVSVSLLGSWGAWFSSSRITERVPSEWARVEVEGTAHRVDAPVAAAVIMSKFEIGALLAAGDVVVELDCEPQLRRHRAEAKLLQAIHPELEALRRVIAAEEQAQASEQRAGHKLLWAAQARRQQADIEASFYGDESTRVTRLAEDGLISGAELSRAKAQADMQRASRRAVALDALSQSDQRLTSAEKATASIEALRRDLAALEGRRDATSAHMDELEYDIDQCEVRAPIAGRVGSHVTIAAGSFVHKGDTLGTIIPFGRLRVVAGFDPGVALGRVKPGQSARLRLASFPWTEFGSVMSSVERVASEPEGGSLRVELGIPPDAESIIPLEHGLTGSVEVDVLELSPASLVLRSIGRLVSADARFPAP